MANSGFTILCTGDLHLGRHPSRIPSGIDDPSFSPKAIWRRTVEAALDHDVDLVAVTGDVVDRENRYYGAYGPFENGIRSLEESGVPVVAVAGNHDFDVLPRIVDELDADNLELLGREGTWERTSFDADDGQVYIDGWSFPTKHVRESPIASYDPEPAPDRPVVGLVHADLDARGSDYAPIETDELHETPADVWLLGHIHRPSRRVETDPLVLYPGSPQPLDPGETGTHGPWLVTVPSRGEAESRQLPLASLCYDTLEVDVDGIDDAKGVPAKVSEHLETHVGNEIQADVVELLLARVHLVGRTPAHGELARERHDLEDQLALNVDGLPVRIESLEVGTRPPIDLEDLAGGETPVGVLADLLLDIEADRVDDRHRRVVTDAKRALDEAHRASAYRVLRQETDAAPPTEVDAIEFLERQGWLLLEALLEQKEASA